MTVTVEQPPALVVTSPDPGAARRPGPVARVLLSVLELYRTAISPLRPPACRYLPSCSAYAAEAVLTHGALRGCWLAARRLSRCHPFHRGGHDPVPPRVSRTAGAPAQPSAPSPAAEE